MADEALPRLPRSPFTALDAPPVLPLAPSSSSQPSADNVGSVPVAPRTGATRLESLLQIILAEQREQAERIGRLQAGIDQLNARLGGTDEPLAAPHEPEHTPPPPIAETGASTAAHQLLTLASEVALLNALSEVLTRNHADAQQRAAAAAARLQRAEAVVAAATGTGALSLPPAPGEEVLAIEYHRQEADDAAQGADAAADGQPVQPYRDSRALARLAAARDSAIVQRSREILALTAPSGDGDGDDEATEVALPSPRAASRSSSPTPRDRTPAASGALVLRGTGNAALASRMSANVDLRTLLDFVLTDADFANVMALLAAVGGNAGPPPASADAIAAIPEVQLRSAEEQEASCPVCLVDLGCGSVKALPCGTERVPHAFHAACIESWLRLHNSCPTCRAPLQEPQATRPEAAL